MKFILEEIKKYDKKQGIYALKYNNEVFYIGKSTNLGNRLREHRKPSAFNNILQKIIKEEGKCNRCKELAMYAFIDKHREDIDFDILETTELNQQEEFYITKYQPKYNYKGVDIPYSKEEKNNG